MNHDIAETNAGRAELAKELSERLGFEVRVDKIANRILVYKVVTTAVVVAELTEQELLASESPMELLRSMSTAELKVPPYISVHRDDLERGEVLFLRTSKQKHIFFTYSSAMVLDERKARNELAQGLRELYFNPRTDERKTLVLLGEPRFYKDPITNMCQAWADLTTLDGWNWRWDEEQKMMVEED